MSFYFKLSKLFVLIVFATLGTIWYSFFRIEISVRVLKVDWNYLAEIQKKFANVPVEFLANKPEYESGCAKLPEISKLQFGNVHWQTTNDGGWQIFGAYFDARSATIRLLVMTKQLQPNLTYCHIWFEDEVVTVESRYDYAWHPQWGGYKDGEWQPFLVSCSISSVLKVFGTKSIGTKRNFAVCVKSLDLKEDLSVRLIEWIELMRILGAEKIVFYKFELHPNIEKVFEYYQTIDRIELITFSSVSDQLLSFLHSDLTFKRKNEVIAYNDCFYKNVNEFNYVVILDIDEVIVPINNTNWLDLIQSIDGDYSAYFARHVYFFDDQPGIASIPNQFHILNHVKRSAIYSPVAYYSKTIFNAAELLIAHNHFPLACVDKCMSYRMPIEM